MRHTRIDHSPALILGGAALAVVALILGAVIR